MPKIYGIEMDEWRCGKVIYRGDAETGAPPVTCQKFISWIPSVHIKRDGEEDCHVLMGAHALCDICRLQFRIEDLEQFSMWSTVLGQFTAENRPLPRRKDIEVEWIAVEDYLKSVTI